MIEFLARHINEAHFFWPQWFVLIIIFGRFAIWVKKVFADNDWSDFSSSIVVALIVQYLLVVGGFYA